MWNFMKIEHGSACGIKGLKNLGIEGILWILKRTERSDINKSSIFNRQYSIPALPG